MSDDKNMYVTSVINLDLWNAAKWKATFVASDGINIPILGLAFENEKAGKKIFEEWIKRFGDKDIFDEIRVAIIEGDIPGEEAGYTVHINTATENIIRRLKANNIKPEDTLIMTIGRYNRMNPEPDSKNLSFFKQEYLKHKRYKLIPAYITKDLQIKPFFNLSIEKQEVIFRNTKDIDENDLDYVVFNKNVGK
ncbi:MAG: hypothetical protein ABF633_01665 [Clostridium sp.]|uniref:hypothetical protein n=1 Tax=Clostridium sp. TaxID=1506 RepID=UPI0039E955C4